MASDVENLVETPTQELFRYRSQGSLSLRDGLRAYLLKGIQIRWLVLGCAAGLATMLALQLYVWALSPLPEVARKLSAFSLFISPLIALGVYLASLVPTIVQSVALSRCWIAKTGLFEHTSNVVVFFKNGIQFSNRFGMSFQIWNSIVGYRKADGIICLYFHFPRSWIVLSRSKMERPEEWPTVVGIISQAIRRI